MTENRRIGEFDFEAVGDWVNVINILKMGIVLGGNQAELF